MRRNSLRIGVTRVSNGCYKENDGIPLPGRTAEGLNGEGQIDMHEVS